MLSALIHLCLFGLLGYYIAENKDDTVIFSPPYSVSLVAGDQPGEGGQNGVEPPAVVNAPQPVKPAEDTTVTVPEKKPKEPAETTKETPKKDVKTPAPAVVDKKKETPAEKKTETTEDLDSAIEKIRKKIEAEEAQKKKEQEKKLLAEKAKEAAASPPKGPAVPSATGDQTPAPGKPGGGNPYGYDNVFAAGGSGRGVPDADLSAYYSEIWKRIRSLWAIPEGMTSANLSAVYGIRIDREGAIVDVWLEDGSGNGAFDDSALRAIRKADPLPRIPDKYTDTTIDVGIRFHSDKR
jgi:TonB family protein